MTAARKVYEVDLPEGTTPEDGLALVRRRARELGIRIEGDVSAGAFEGMAAGRYELDGRRLRLEVTKKPVFLPWATIEGGLRSVFGKVQVCASDAEEP